MPTPLLADFEHHYLCISPQIYSTAFFFFFFFFLIVHLFGFFHKVFFFLLKRADGGHIPQSYLFLAVAVSLARLGLKCEVATASDTIVLCGK